MDLGDIALKGPVCGAEHQTVNNLAWCTWAGGSKHSISRALSLISSPAFLRPGECDNKDKIVILSEGSDSKKKKK